MFHHILIPTDGSLLSAAVVEAGIALARGTGARVTVLTVIEPMTAWWGEVKDGGATATDTGFQTRQKILKHLAHAERQAQVAGVPCSTLEVEHDHPTGESPRLPRRRDAISSPWLSTAGVDAPRW
jgi:nucleotide-binding universal stress UspA family protein